MDNLTKEQRRKTMQHIRATDTLPERLVMAALKRRKIYFAANVASLPGKPDIVFRRKHVVVFIDSDFWHGHPKRFQMPAVNKKYWENKINRNKARDKQVIQKLRRQGWRVVRIWAYDVSHDLEKVLSRIVTALENE